MGTETFAFLSREPINLRREDGSPSWGRKLIFHFAGAVIPSTVEKMGPLRGDGNYPCVAKAEIPKQKVVTY